MISLILLIVFQFPFYFLTPKWFTPSSNSQFKNSIIKSFMAFLMLLFSAFIAEIIPFIFSLYFIVWAILFIMIYLSAWTLFCYKVYRKDIVFNWQNNKTDLAILLIFIFIALFILLQSITRINDDNYFYLNLIKGNNWLSPLNAHGSYSNNLGHQTYYVGQSYYLLISLFAHISNDPVLSLMYSNKVLAIFFVFLIFLLYFDHQNKTLIWLFLILAILFILEFYYTLIVNLRGLELSLVLGPFLLYFLKNIYNKNSKISNFYLIGMIVAIASTSIYFLVVGLFIMISYMIWSKKTSNSQLMVFYCIFMMIIIYGLHDIYLILSAALYLTLPIIYFVINKLDIAHYINKIFKIFNFSIMWLLFALSGGLLIIYLILNFLKVIDLGDYYYSFMGDVLPLGNYNIENSTFTIFIGVSVIVFISVFAISLTNFIKYKNIPFREYIILIALNPLFWPIFRLLLHGTIYRMYLVLTLEMFLIFYYFILNNKIIKKIPEIKIFKPSKYILLTILMAPLISSVWGPGVYSINPNSAFSIRDDHSNFLRSSDFKKFNQNLTSSDLILVSYNAQRGELFLKKSYFLISIWDTVNQKDFHKSYPNIATDFSNSQIIDALNRTTNNIENHGIIDNADYQFLQKVKIDKILVYTTHPIEETTKSHITILSNNAKNYDLLKVTYN